VTREKHVMICILREDKVNTLKQLNKTGYALTYFNSNNTRQIRGQELHELCLPVGNRI